MDAEYLRNTYNRYFSQPDNKWTTSNLKEALRIARKITHWLKRDGFSVSAPRVLDVGSATGYYTEAFRLTGYASVGLEYSDVAIEQAKKNFPACRFVQMNGFEPSFQEQFDVVFCRGFSGTNTHDLDFIASWINRYMPLLTSNGFFVLAYSTDYSGKEQAGETVNFSREELNQLSGMINGRVTSIRHNYFLGWISVVKKWIWKSLLGKKQKVYFYMLIRKE
jgi:SAM-dependent methyltransferase